MKRFLKKIKMAPSFGLYCVYAGVVVFLLSYITDWSRYNWVLFLGLFFVVFGIIAYTYLSRKQNKY
ncbi:hypothetical protein BFS16_05075 [Hoylesella timonensis]|uniref:Uncharacterized protein n=1 Tax=Hoylesella timonensis TaxID=386414 RepID=A0A2K0XMJ4_9BACT|nr:hypothetical protein BFS16_05075 [Hoylesella timonensis]